MQKTMLIGHLGADAVVRSVSEDRDACNFRMATNENWLDKAGNVVEHTEWHTVVAYGKKGRFDKMMEKGMFGKGAHLYVEGVSRTKLSPPNAEGIVYQNTQIVVDPRVIQFLGANPNAVDPQAQKPAATPAPAADPAAEAAKVAAAKAAADKAAADKAAAAAKAAEAAKTPEPAQKPAEPPMDFDDDIPFG